MEMQIWAAGGNQFSTCMDRNDAVDWLDESGVCEERDACDYRNSCWWDGNLTCANPDAEGYDAFDYTHLIHRFYSEVFGRRSYDDHYSVYRMYLDVSFQMGRTPIRSSAAPTRCTSFQTGTPSSTSWATKSGTRFTGLRSATIESNKAEP